MSAKKFNDKHPELRPGEIWITNALPGRFMDGREDIASMDWKTKRVGNQAYDSLGKPIDPTTGYRPVFIQKSEREEREDKRTKANV